MEIQTIKICINCVSVLLHILSLITAIYCFFLIIHRWSFKRHHRQRVSINSITPFDDSITLLLFGNTYFILILYSTTWLSILIHTISGDFSIFESILYLKDSINCRVRIGLIYFLTSAFFHSYFLQALRCFFKVVFHSTLNEKKLWYLPLNHMCTYIILILTSWLISILILIPAVTIFDVFSYFPEEHHCMISFTNIPGCTYAILSAYIIPVVFIIYIYSRLIVFIHYTYKSDNISRGTREIKIVKRILTICFILTFTGSETIFFLFQFIITDRMHPLVDRIHELGIAICDVTVTLGFAYLNAFFKSLPMRSSI
jgi:hypothetical protein